MDDIRLFETDGDYLVLEAQDGQKYRLLIDESVRASIKREPQQLLDSVSITPREIQDEIRNGATIDELVKRSGAQFDYIEKFAAPVIAELKHMVDSALSVRLTIAGDRYSDTNQIEFGEIINSRLVTSGASGIFWNAERLEPMRWHITANYQLNGAAGSATWSFDPRHLTLSPESETAVTLSSQETLNNSVIPKLKTVDLATQQETQVFEDVIPIGRGSVDETPVAVAPVVDIAPEPELAPVASAPVSIPTPKQSLEPESLSATADLLEALRRKRNERSDTNLEAHPATQGLRVIDIEAPVAEPKLVAEVATPEPVANDDQAEENKPAASRKGRAAMPSWDEIVFGTKAED